MHINKRDFKQINKKKTNFKQINTKSTDFKQLFKTDEN